MQIGANSLLQEMQSLKGEVTPSFGISPNNIVQQVN
ncbi:MAG: flagellar hook-basal body complex protein FliE, partial [Shewanella sp.]